MMMLMIRMNRTQRYRLLTLLELARHRDGPMTKREIARRRGIPESFLAHVASGLVRDGLVLSRRGPMGGLRLARDAAAISLADVLPLPAAGCEAGPVLERLDRVLSETLTDTLRRLSVADLVAWENEAHTVPNYVI